MFRHTALAIVTLTVIALGTPATAGTGLLKGYCEDYGYRCFRPFNAASAPRNVLDGILSPDGDYIGSVAVEGGLCVDGLFTCEPCQESQRQDFNAACNERFPECGGDCFAR